MSDKEILDLELGGQTIREMTALSFLQWLAKKANGLPSYDAATQEIRLAATAVPMSRTMPDEEKCRLVRKLLALNVPVP